jgi:hypothetical protein
MPLCSLTDKELTISPNHFKLERIPCILGFPDKMSRILSLGMFGTFQIHFFTPKTFIRNNDLTIFVNLIHWGFSFMDLTNSQEIHVIGEGNFSLCL